MTTATPPLGAAAIELPATAPQVRITAGAGSPGQKTWNLRRPVTLLGSRRPAQIILHDRNVSKAHCVIVNTGSDVLLKDLHTAGGTFRNNAQVDLAALQDGDVIRIGTMNIQVAIQTPPNQNEDSGCGMACADPTKLASPMLLRLEHTDREWTISDAVVLVGKHIDAAVSLDHPVVARRHALLFKFNNGPAVFDVGSPGGVVVNGSLCTIAALRGGERVGIGPCTLVVNPPPRAPADTTADQIEEVCTADPASTGSNNGPATSDTDRPQSSTGHLEGLEVDITDSWDRINRWGDMGQRDKAMIDAEKDLTSLGAELDARDASLRGILHDLTRYQQQIGDRERELGTLRDQIEGERGKLAAVEAECVRREAEIARRTAELKRREHVLAQRWTRLLNANCPHCGQPVRVENATAADAPMPP